MVYAKICGSCLINHDDIVENKISKGCILGVTKTDNKNECYLKHIHGSEEKTFFVTIKGDIDLYDMRDIMWNGYEFMDGKIEEFNIVENEEEE